MGMNKRMIIKGKLGRYTVYLKESNAFAYTAIAYTKVPKKFLFFRWKGYKRINLENFLYCKVWAKHEINRKLPEDLKRYYQETIERYEQYKIAWDRFNKGNK